MVDAEGYSVVHADVLDWAASYDGEPFHALLCDPPYELGFMGKDWDRSGVAFKSETWAALAEHLHPGAFGMAFASARGWHRLAVAIEDAGYRIHPSIFGWAYGSGFPKATRIDTQIDRAAGAEREMVGKNPNHRNPGGNAWPAEHQPHTDNGNLTAPVTPLAQAWEGHRYGLQALKPALEPIIVFQKPYQGKPMDSITETGAGALWIDGGRIGTGLDRIDGGKSGDVASSVLQDGFHQARQDRPTGSRWPANFYTQHHPDCVCTGERRVRGSSERVQRKTGDEGKGRSLNTMMRPAGYTTSGYADPDGLETVAVWDCVPECPVRRLGEQSGERVSQGGWANGHDGGKSSFGLPTGRRNVNPYAGQSGTAARFFYQSHWGYEVQEQIDAADPVRYEAKASRKERDVGLEGMLAQTIQTGCGGDFPTDDQGRERDRFKATVRNPHLTVKPIALARWLATLLLPPDAYAPRRILIPFCGSGSEGIGAGLAGWEYMTLIDNDTEVCEITRVRLTYWLSKITQLELELA